MTLRFQSLLGLMTHLRFLVKVVSNFAYELSEYNEYYIGFLANDLNAQAYVVLRNGSIEVKPLITVEEQEVLAILKIEPINSSYHLSAIKV